MSYIFIILIVMIKNGPTKADRPALIEAKPEERMTIVDGVRERMKKVSLSFLEEYVMQKAIALFLLGERSNWVRLYARVMQDGQEELSVLQIPAQESDTEVRQVMNSLEEKELLFFEKDNEAELRIASVSDQRSCFVRSVHHPEYVHHPRGW